jgi:PTH1 family peptidyl-tRNA hydrolase
VKLVVGLGNPGDIYAGSRHNIGFFAVKALSRVNKISLKKDRDTFSLSGKGKIGAQTVILAMPLTFMNLSGIAVKALLKKHKVHLDNLLVVCDDLDLEFGRQKLKPHGSSGGHRGLNSIIESVKDASFARLRIGIGRPHIQDADPREYVLSPFNKKEKEQINKILKRAVACCQAWAQEGILKSMNIFNRKGN